MYQMLVYSITPYTWRWEIRSGRTLLRCGTSRTKTDAERAASTAINV
jgi:hypothetical protein